MSILIKKDIAWNSIIWTLVQKRVLRIQNRIFKASKNGNKARVRGLQIRLINSLDAKLLSVLKVTTLNKGRKTPGVDKTIIIDGKDKVTLALNLSLDGTARPIRRVWIPKPGKTEKRPLGIPTIIDRAKQQLAKLALEPEWEAKFEPNSYGFRPGRSCHDAIEAIFLCLRHKREKHVYDADIRKCFDKISHEALLGKLDTFPQMERQIKSWLEADIMEGYANAPKEISKSTMGTPQGGIISPLLANIALHGLENHIKEYAGQLEIKTNSQSNRGVIARKKAVSVIRYADDFVIIHENKQVLELCIEETKRWLADVGLEISEEKSKLRSAQNGFKFLGFSIILVKRAGTYRTVIKPSKASCLKLIDKIGNVLSYSKAVSTYELISKLRPIIIGWANYFRYSECSDTFHRLTDIIFRMLRAWVFRRDTRNGRKVVKERYFPSGKTYNFNNTKHRDNWILVGKTTDSKGRTKTNFLPHIVWVKSIKHVKVKGDKSPYDGDQIYWTKRMSKYSNYPERFKVLMAKQNFKCGICKVAFLCTDTFEIDHIIPKSQGGSDKYDNLQLTHRLCHVGKTRNEASMDFSQAIIPIDKPNSAYYDTPTLDEIYESEGF